MSKPPFTITIDTREQKPPSFRGLDVATEVATVDVFDFCISGDKGWALERKSLGDFVNSITVTQNWNRELRKIEKARERFYEGATINYIVESSLSDLVDKYDYGRRKISPNFTLKRVRELSIDYGVQIWFVGNKRTSAMWIYRLLRHRYHMLKAEGKS